MHGSSSIITSVMLFARYRDMQLYTAVKAMIMAQQEEAMSSSRRIRRPASMLVVICPPLSIPRNNTFTV
jgi:hypothetical protein